MQWMVWMFVVSVYTQTAVTEEQEPINRDGRLLFKNREWRDEYRSAVATIERAAATQPQFQLEDDNLLDILEPRPFLTGRGGGDSEGRRRSPPRNGGGGGGGGGGSIPTFRFPSEKSEEEEGRQDLLERSISRRQGRVMSSPSSNGSSDALASRELQQEKPLSGETSRKASPDVQDIIDGIVKLLGGKVHNGAPGGGGQQPGGYGQRPASSPNPVYNLFNPTKPIVFPTSKPTRVNNRGPGGLSSGGGGGGGSPGGGGGGGYNGGYPATSDPSKFSSSSNSPQSSFEAIPLEALNSEFNLNKSNFGPPFSLNKVQGGGGGSVDAPYKKGVPVPEQLVPTLPSGGNYNNRYSNSNSNPPPYPQYNYNPNFSNNNYGSTLLNPTSGRPTTSGTRKPPTSSTLLNPVNNSPGGISSRPIVTTQGEGMEDDEEDEMRFTTHPAGAISSPGELIPIRQEDFKTSKSVESVEIRPTPTLPPPGGDNVYPTLVLETNSENGLVEIVTKYETFSVSPTAAFHTPTYGNPQASSSVTPPVFPPGGDGHKHVSSLSTSTSKSTTSLATTQKGSTSTGLSSSTSNPLVSSSLGPQSIHSFPTPPLRPGIVLNENVVGGSRGGGVGSVEVVTALDNQHGLIVPGEAGGAGEVFDVTVTAKQSYGGQNTGLPFGLAGPGVIGEVVKDEVITVPKGTEQFVSIDGKRTYFNLQPNTALPGGAGVTGIPGQIAASSAVLPTQSVRGTILPVLDGPAVTSTRASTSSTTQKPSRPQSIGVGSVGDPVPLLPQAPGKTLFNSNTPVRPVSTSLNIQPGDKAKSPPPNLVRRPFGRRPTVPPVRIDTCIVGDDSTCNSDQFEVCRTENGVSSCVCRSGYARRKHREPCKAIVSLIMSIKLEKLGDKKLSYNPDYFNPNSEIYQTLEWETIHALDSSMSETTLSGGYVGSKLDSIGFDGKHAVVNATVLIQENAKVPPSKVKLDLQKQMIQVLTRNRNNFGKSQLWVEGPISAVSAITDFDECEDSDTNDCHSKAECVNTLGSFECKCHSGYGDPFEKDKRRSGRRCESCSGKNHCNGRGECLIENGQRICMCSGNYYGSQCDIDGEVLAVAIGASVSAVVIIGLTLACLCMWSRKWKKEEQKAALMSRMPFGGMATQALSYLGGKVTNPYQQHISMDERLRWAQVADGNMSGNIYVQNDPMSMHTSPTLMGQTLMESPPMMSARRSAETVDTTMEDLFIEERQPKRPRSRASQSQLQGGIYYDLEPDGQNEIYASRSMMHIPPAQFCVPMTPMGHYAHSSRGFYT